VNNALNLGLTPEEICETLLHAGIYGGVSGWANAWNVARDVFVKRDIITSS
jgi:4-carboxymuconolactone decarboxylase